MSRARPRTYYTAVFLHVSFQAIRHSMAGKASDDLPCWPDTGLLLMLARELRECSERLAPASGARTSLDLARDHCGLLLARCPGGLTSRLCQYHLDAILAALQEAIGLVAEPTAGFWRASDGA